MALYNMADQGMLTGEINTRFEVLKDSFISHNLKDNQRKCIFSTRAIFVTVALGTAIINSFTGMAIPLNNVDCMWDGLFELTEPINAFFVANNPSRHLLLIFSSFLIDLQYVYFCIHYMLWGKSARPLIFLSLFYLFRMMIQNIFMMKYPTGMAWDYPGIPSLVISYAYTTDFFFSGHAGIMVFTTLENYKNNNIVMMWLSIFSVFVEFFVMIVLRGHYSIDLISGIVFGHYFWILSNKLAKKTEERFYKKKCDYIKIEKSNSNIDSTI